MRKNYFIVAVLLLTVFNCSSQDLDALFKSGNAKKANKDWDGAIGDYTKVIKLDGNNATAFFNRASCNSEKKDYVKATPDYTKVIELSKDGKQKSKAFYFRAICNKNHKKTKEAIADYNSATEIDTTFAEAFLGSAQLKSSTNDHKGAIADFNKVIQFNPKNHQIYYLRASSYNRIGQSDKVLEDCTKALEIKADYTPAMNLRANINYSIGNKQIACDDWKKSSGLGDKTATQMVAQYCK